MIKHIVMFKLKAFESDSEKMQVMKEIKESLEGLKLILKEVQHIEIQFNVNPNEEYDLILISEFKNLTDLETYAKHPEHIKASRLIAENKIARACVDYEIV